MGIVPGAVGILMGAPAGGKVRRHGEEGGI